jgi:hypothetical protein
MQRSVSPFKTRLKGMPSRFCFTFSLFEREQPLLHSDALIKSRWTHSEWALINAQWYYPRLWSRINEKNCDLYCEIVRGVM